MHTFYKLVGQVIGFICPTDLPCDKSKCHLRPFCQCAQQELAESSKTDNAVWILLAIVSIIVIICAILF